MHEHIYARAKPAISGSTAKGEPERQNSALFSQILHRTAFMGKLNLLGIL